AGAGSSATTRNAPAPRSRPSRAATSSTRNRPSGMPSSSTGSVVTRRQVSSSSASIRPNSASSPPSSRPQSARVGLTPVGSAAGVGRGDGGGLPGSLDLGRGDRHPIPGPQRVVDRGRLAVDPDEEVVGLAARALLGEQPAERQPVGDVDVVGEPAAVVVDEQD